MGRKTYESIGRPLPGRPNLVLTRNPSFRAKGVETFTDTHEMIGRGFELSGLTGQDEVMLIGGAQLYASCFKYVSKMYITEVDAMIEGDAHFPAVQAYDWIMVSETPYPQGPKDDFPFSVKVFERK